MSSPSTFTITTPIYYPSADLHIGNSYTTVAADAIARYKKLRGFDVMFMTGTDEHGQKIERIARENGMTPKDYVDRIVEGIRSLWGLLETDYDVFTRTTDEKHRKTVQTIFKSLYEKGDIYKSSYEGLYCTPCETFFTERQLVDGKCPDCGRGVEKVREESYFFRLSRYQDRLIRHIEENPSFIMPQSRRNEMLNNFLRPGLEDLCVSRTSFTWGIPVDFDEGHVVYVWIDALSNYISGLGYSSEQDGDFRKYWPADVHLVGKDILRFHAIIWPAMLMALDLPLPKQIFGHGWLLMDNGKMSKSKGNVIDPRVLVEKYGVDAIRYFLLREISFGQDGNFSQEALLLRINSDLANDLGNLLSRTAGMIDKYFQGRLPDIQSPTAYDADLTAVAQNTITRVEAAMDNLLLSDALSEIWVFVRRANKYVDETQPWVLVKDEALKPELANALYHLAESLRVIAVLISPFMVHTPRAIAERLSMEDPALMTWESTKSFGLLPRTFSTQKGGAIFPRIDIEKELGQETEAKPSETEKNSGIKPVQEKKTEQKEEQNHTITIDDFAKIQLRTGIVLECAKAEGSDKLLVSKIKIGDRIHQIVSGIAKHYTPEEMAGKKVVVVTNLKPVKIRGILSEGMILAASHEENGQEGSVRVVTIDGEMPDGAVVR